jgi:hypothetical protein
MSVLFLVDNQHSDSTFWYGVPAGMWPTEFRRCEVNLDTLQSRFKVSSVAGYIKDVSVSDGIYVITDALFGNDCGNDQDAGRALLNELSRLQSFERGCVYSRDTGELKFAAEDRCLAFQRLAGEPGREEELREILEFLKTGQRPRRLSEDGYRGLGQAIHALRNLPCRIDAATVRDMVSKVDRAAAVEAEANSGLAEGDRTICEEVWASNFGCREAGKCSVSILLEKACQGLEGQINSEDLKQRVSRAQSEIAESEARCVKPASWDVEGARGLREGLEKATKAVDDLVEFLSSMRSETGDRRLGSL